VINKKKMKQDRMDGLTNKNVVVFTRNNFRFQGVVKGYDGKFLEIYDDVKGKIKIVNVDEIIEVEVKDNNDQYATGIDKQVNDSRAEIHYAHRNQKLKNQNIKKKESV